MTRKIWAIVAFGLGVALAPLVHQLGTVCLHPVAVVAQDQLEPLVLPPTIDNPTPAVNLAPIPQRAADAKVDEFRPALVADPLSASVGSNENDLPPQTDSLPPRGDEFSSVTETATNPVDAFLELSRQKAALLTPEEMAREVESLCKELAELRATAQLREATEKLKRLVGEHPQSQAAQRAARMLEVETAPSPGANRPPVSETDPFDAPELPTRSALPTR